MDTIEVITRAKAGDHAAFEQLYRALYAPVYRFAVLRLKSKDDADDVTQQVFIKFFNALPRFEPQESALPYLLTIARNAIIDHLRRRKPDLDDDALWAVASTEPTPEQTAHLGGEVSRVLVALNQLSDAEEAVIKMKYLDSLETSEIANILGKQEDAVRQLLSRGLRRARILLEGTGPI